MCFGPACPVDRKTKLSARSGFQWMPGPFHLKHVESFARRVSIAKPIFGHHPFFFHPLPPVALLFRCSEVFISFFWRQCLHTGDLSCLFATFILSLFPATTRTISSALCAV